MRTVRNVDLVSADDLTEQGVATTVHFVLMAVKQPPYGQDLFQPKDLEQ
jgi:hypothetical protein